MNSKAINKIFTKVLTEKLSTGKYIIATEPMKGHQGEIAKVCLQDVETEKFYVLYLNDESGTWVFNKSEEGYRKPSNWDRRELIWAEAENGYRENDTLWLNRCKKIEVKQFFRINDCGRRYWFGTLDEVISAYELHKQRYENKSFNNCHRIELKDNVKVYKWALKRVEREHGFKTGAREIVSVELVQRTDEGKVVSYYVMIGIKRTNAKGEVTRKNFRYDICNKRY